MLTAALESVLGGDCTFSLVMATWSERPPIRKKQKTATHKGAQRRKLATRWPVRQRGAILNMAEHRASHQRGGLPLGT